jgi:hypothetical protein
MPENHCNSEIMRMETRAWKFIVDFEKADRFLTFFKVDEEECRNRSIFWLRGERFWTKTMRKTSEIIREISLYSPFSTSWINGKIRVITRSDSVASRRYAWSQDEYPRFFVTKCHKKKVTLSIFVIWSFSTELLPKTLVDEVKTIEWSLKNPILLPKSDLQRSSVYKPIISWKWLKSIK